MIIAFLQIWLPIWIGCGYPWVLYVGSRWMIEGHRGSPAVDISSAEAATYLWRSIRTDACLLFLAAGIWVVFLSRKIVALARKTVKSS
jgi:hypothetical protein